MDYITELAAIASEHGGIIESKIAAQHGISKAMLYKLCKEDKIYRIIKGQYILSRNGSIPSRDFRQNTFRAYRYRALRLYSFCRYQRRVQGLLHQTGIVRPGQNDSADPRRKQRTGV